MKKFVCLLMVAMLALSLSAVVSASDDMIQPLIDCDHHYGTYSVPKTEQRGCKKEVSYDAVYCSECGTHLRDTNIVWGTNSRHVGGTRTELVQKGSTWYRYTYCKSCGAELGKELVQM